jgi:hypothetical protein
MSKISQNEVQLSFAIAHSPKTYAPKGVFCYAGLRTYPHRYIATQLQSQLNEYNQALECKLRSISLLGNSAG